MSFLEDKCSLYRLTEPTEMNGFSCGDSDLDEFFTKDSFDYTRELLGKTYCFRMMMIHKKWFAHSLLPTLESELVIYQMQEKRR